MQEYVGGGRLSEEIVRASIERSRESFEADPNAIVEGTRTMRDFQEELGTLAAPVDLSALFLTRFYDALPKE